MELKWACLRGPGGIEAAVGGYVCTYVCTLCTALCMDKVPTYYGGRDCFLAPSGSREGGGDIYIPTSTVGRFRIYLGTVPIGEPDRGSMPVYTTPLVRLVQSYLAARKGKYF